MMEVIERAARAIQNLRSIERNIDEVSLAAQHGALVMCHYPFDGDVRHMTPIPLGWGLEREEEIALAADLQAMAMKRLVFIRDKVKAKLKADLITLGVDAGDGA